MKKKDLFDFFDQNPFTFTYKGDSLAALPEHQQAFEGRLASHTKKASWYVAIYGENLKVPLKTPLLEMWCYEKHLIIDSLQISQEELFATPEEAYRRFRTLYHEVKAYGLQEGFTFRRKPLTD